MRIKRKKRGGGIAGKKFIEWVVARYHELGMLYLELFLYDVVCVQITYIYYALGMPLGPVWDDFGFSFGKARSHPKRATFITSFSQSRKLLIT